MAATETHPAIHAIETVFRIESPKLIAGLARIVRDVGSPKISPRTPWSRCAEGSRS